MTDDEFMNALIEAMTMPIKPRDPDEALKLDNGSGVLFIPETVEFPDESA